VPKRVISAAVSPPASCISCSTCDSCDFDFRSSKLGSGASVGNGGNPNVAAFVNTLIRCRDLKACRGHQPAPFVR
jgi:hypothetical protein